MDGMTPWKCHRSIIWDPFPPEWIPTTEAAATSSTTQPLMPQSIYYAGDAESPIDPYAHAAQQHHRANFSVFETMQQLFHSLVPWTTQA